LEDCILVVMGLTWLQLPPPSYPISLSLRVCKCGSPCISTLTSEEPIVPALIMTVERNR